MYIKIAMIFSRINKKKSMNNINNVLCEATLYVIFF